MAENMPEIKGMPPEVVSKAEMLALQSFELLTGASLAAGPDNLERSPTTKGAKLATGARCWRNDRLGCGAVCAHGLAAGDHNGAGHRCV